jgi:hypothetical protein
MYRDISLQLLTLFSPQDYKFSFHHRYRTQKLYQERQYLKGQCHKIGIKISPWSSC